MPASKKPEPKRRFFTVDEANKSLTYVSVVVADIVKQIEKVNTLRQRLATITGSRKKPVGDVYTEELAQSQTEVEVEERKLSDFVDELTRAGVELKGPDGLCDFPSLRDGRPIYLCWRLGEPSVQHWHEIDAGFTGRQPLEAAPAQTGSRTKY